MYTEHKLCARVLIYVYTRVLARKRAERGSEMDRQIVSVRGEVWAKLPSIIGSIKICESENLNNL